MKAERLRFLNDLITTAVEGGIGYWSIVSKYKWDGVEKTTVHVQTDEPDIVEGFPNEGKTIGPEEMEAAINAMIEKGSDGVKCHERYISAIAGAMAINDSGSLDAEDADLVMQVACFGYVIYG